MNDASAISKRAIPAAGSAGSANGGSMTLAQVQDQLQQIVATALQIDGPAVDPQASFLELGASSLALVDAFRAIAERFGVRPSIRKVFDEYDTIERLAEYIIDLQENQPSMPVLMAPSAKGPQPPNRAASVRLPLTAAQHHLWFLARYSEGAMLAHTHRLVYQLDGPLDLAALQNAFQMVTNRHEGLRITFDPAEDDQRLLSELPVAVEFVDFGRAVAEPNGRAADQQRAVAEWLKEESRRPFDVQDRLWRVAVLRLSPPIDPPGAREGGARHLLVISGHGLILDPGALRQMVTEVATVYSALAFSALDWPAPAEAGVATGSDLGLRLPEPLSFRDYIDWLAAQEAEPDQAGSDTDRDASEFQRAREYWINQFQDGVPPLNLPFWQHRPPVKMYDGARLIVPLGDSLSQALRDWNTGHKSTAYPTMLAAYQGWLQRMTGQNDLVVGIFNRGTPVGLGHHLLLANSTNPLPLRAQVRPESSFADQVQSAQRLLLAAFDHRDYPFSALIQDLHPERDQSRSPLFTVALDWEPEAAAPAFSGLVANPVTPPIQYAPYDLLLTIVEANGRLQLQCDYSTELLSAADMRRWMSSFKTFLAACLTEPETPLCRLPMLTVEERQQIVYNWNDSQRSYPQETLFHQLIEAQVDRSPDAVAVIDDEHSLTYAELEAQANQLAHRLRQLGVGPHVFVGLASERNTAMMVGLLAIMKAGGAYLPLDPTYPQERLVYMLADAGAPVLLTTSELADHFGGYTGTCLYLDQRPAVGLPATRLGGQPGDGRQSSCPAYIIYTSGSTGRPKGVPISHRSLVNFATALSDVMGISDREIALATTSVSFDIAAAELYLPLVAGGTVVLVSRQRAIDSQWMSERLRQTGATLMQATPSHWQMLLDAGWQPPADRDLTIMCAGEALPQQVAQRLVALGGPVWNWYGPTETTIYSSGCLVTAGGEGQPGSDQLPVNIGRPLANNQLYVLDAYGQPAPIGVPGELYIGGDGLSPGYWRRPALAAERFVPDPFSGRPGARLYRTGDLVRFRPDGTIDFLGRADFQVKIRGYRIELGEIEAILDDHPHIERSVVVARIDETRPAGSATPQLVAYFTARPANGSAQAQRPLTTSELREYLSQRLPEYMIPAAFVPLAQFPLTPNGKVDRKALPAPDQERRAGSAHHYAPPTNRVEEILCRIWSELLNLGRVGIHDNFFELGGSSLLLTPLVLKVRDYFNLRISMREFFARPTVAELAEMIAEARAAQHAQSSGGNGPGTNGVDGFLLRPAAPQDGPAAKARFDFLRREAALADDIVPQGTPYQPGAPINRLLMTGATGFVGGYIVHDMLALNPEITLYCLVRAETAGAGLGRIQRQMEKLGVWRSDFHSRIRPVLGDVSRSQLGLDDASYQKLALEVDTILHSAALVNFIYPYQSLRQVNVSGVQEMIRLAFTGRVKPFHYLSTTAVWPMGAHRSFREDSPLDHDLLLNLPYDETKWVAEKMLQHAAERGLPVAVYRPGEVSGDSHTGHSDLSHLASALVKGSIQAGLFPALDSFLDAAPVDYVARATVHLMTRCQPLGRAFHLCNPNPIHAQDAYRLLRARGYQFEVLPFDEWRWRVMSAEDYPENALYPFAALLEEFSERSLQLPVWETAETVAELAGPDTNEPVVCPPLDEKLVGVYLDYYVACGYLPTPEQLLQVA